MSDNTLHSSGQWVHATFEAGEPQVFPFVADKAGTYSIYLACEDDMDRVTFDIQVGSLSQPKGGLNPKVGFALQPGNYSAIVTARDDSKQRKVMYYYSPTVKKR